MATAELFVNVYKAGKKLDMLDLDYKDQELYKDIMFELMRLLSNKLKLTGMEQKDIDIDFVTMSLKGAEIVVKATSYEHVSIKCVDAEDIDIPIPDCLLDMNGGAFKNEHPYRKGLGLEDVQFVVSE